jgi:HlyD family secretion protein
MAQSSPKRNTISTSTLVWAGAGLALAVVMAWLLWPRPLPVQTALVDRGEVTREIIEEARAEVRNLHSVTAPVTGRLERISLRPGDVVKAGQVIAKISSPAASLLDARLAAEAQSALNAARAAVRAAEANLALARGEQERTATLTQSGFASPAALDRVNQTLAAADAEVAARKADVLRAEAAAGYRSGPQASRSIKSPIDGTVLRVLQESEGDVLVGTPLVEIGDPSQMEIVGEFLSQDVALMPEGARVIVSGAGAQPIEGRVRLIEPYARTKVSALGIEEQRVNVVIDLTDSESPPRLGHGYKVDAAVQVFQATGVLRVPTDALVRHNGGWAVFALVDGRSQLRKVAVGDGDDHHRVVLEGLNEGDAVILFPGDAIRDGDLVEAGK